MKYYKFWITALLCALNFASQVSSSSAICDCNELSTCLQRAWSPCTSSGDEELFWMRLHPGHWRYTRCKWEWRQVQLMDFTFRHTKSIMDCLSSHNTCQAAIDLKNQYIGGDKQKESERRCFSNAAICHFTLGRKCQPFRSEVAWNDCWINNDNIAPGLREAVVAAWRCEVQKDLEVDPIESLNDYIAPPKPSPHAEQLQSKRRSNYWDCERFARALGYRIHLECGSLRTVRFER